MAAGGLNAGLDEVRSIYAEWQARAPTRNCAGSAGCCHFRRTGRMPYVTKGEALLAAKAWRTTGRTTLPDVADGRCPFLDERGLCRIYDGRPFGCRTHFCAPAGGPASRAEVRDLVRRLEELDVRWGGVGGVNFIAAVEIALDELGGGRRSPGRKKVGRRGPHPDGR